MIGNSFIFVDVVGTDTINVICGISIDIPIKFKLFSKISRCLDRHIYFVHVKNVTGT